VFAFSKGRWVSSFEGLRVSLVNWQVKAAIFAAGCICRLSEDFSRIILEVFRRLICSQTSEPQVILAAIKAFSKLDCTLAVIHRVHEVYGYTFAA
jgi:hypothetical protein